MHTDSLAGRLLLLALLVPPALAGDELLKLLPPSVPDIGHFGGSIAVADGRVIASNHTAGKKDRGRAEVFDLHTGAHLRSLELDEPIDMNFFGAPIAANERWALIGSRHAPGLGWNSGAVYLFDPRTGAQLRMLTAPDGEGGQSFGSSIAVDGDLALIGAVGDDTIGFHSGAAYLFHLPTGTLLHKWIGSDTRWFDQFGSAVALSGKFAVVGANRAWGTTGAAYVFDVTTGQELHKLQGSRTHRGTYQGWPISISGRNALIGAYYEDDQKVYRAGAAYLFDLETGEELRRFSSPAPSVRAGFGSGLVLAEGLAIISQPGDGNFFTDEGRTWVFDAKTGALLDSLAPSDNQAGDLFGWPIARDGCELVIGSTWHDALGPETGAAYVFAFPSLATSSICSGNANSTGGPAALAAEGTACIAANALTMVATELPAHQLGFFLGSPKAGFVPGFAGGQGDLCLGSPLVRLHGSPLDSGPLGTFFLDVDYSTWSGGAVVHPGETWFFQAWYRDLDPGPTSNLSGGIGIEFH